MTIDSCGVPQLLEPDLRSLKYLIDNISCPKIIEIGCWSGYGTIHLASWAKEKGGHVWSIDTFDGNGSELKNSSYDPYKALAGNLLTFGLQDTVTVIKGRSDDVLDKIPDDCNMVFIDADHRYKQVLRDIDNYSAKVKKGFVTGHDFNGWEWDEKHINEDCVEGNNGFKYHHGVSKAVTQRFPHVNRLFVSVWWHLKE